MWTDDFSQCAAAAGENMRAQLFRYAEDVQALLAENDDLQSKYVSLDRTYRSVSEYRHLLATLMRTTAEGYLSTDLSGKVVGCTHSANLIFGRENLIGIDLSCLIAEASRPEILAIMNGGNAPVSTVRLVHADGRHIAARVRLVSNASDRPQKVIHWIVRPLVDDSIQASSLENEYAEPLSEGLFVTDLAGKVVTVNATFCRITGYEASDVLGLHMLNMNFTVLGDGVLEGVWGQLPVTGGWQGEVVGRRKDGETFPEWLSINAVRGSDGNVVGYFGTFHDLSGLQESEQCLSRMAYYDVLTGLPNRHLFNDRLRMALSNVRRSGKRMGLFFIDLDRFKQINDSLGHDVGDELLISVAQRIKSVIREVDTVARLGGDEFSVILPNLSDPQDAAMVAGKILEACQPAIHVGSHQLQASPSIGVAMFPENGNDESSLLRRADLAMYRAKAEGGNTYRFFEQDDEGESDRLTLETAFRAALKRDELYLVYQPQMAADCTEIVGVEALMRWRHPEFGDVSPNVFIPIAEWTGVITEIGRWLIRTACRQMAEWRNAGIPIRRVAVNVSPRQLRDQNFPNIVIDELRASGLPGSALELEITESELMLYPEATLNKLAEIRSYGISIAIDDFGTGYSNLARLRALPIDRIKVDRSFVLDIEADTNANAISACIVTLAKAMNLEVVAEGVETNGQLEYLLRQGCDLIQGYLFGRPMTPEVLNTWFHEEGGEAQR
jgi:diguanylate cyclase (GGDEF)-like protein/PAS domain S-box-containing protein